jgi:hypothetical protein
MGGRVAAFRMREPLNCRHPCDEIEGEITYFENCIDGQKYLVSRSCEFEVPVEFSEQLIKGVPL